MRSQNNVVRPAFTKHVLTCYWSTFISANCIVWQQHGDTWHFCFMDILCYVKSEWRSQYMHMQEWKWRTCWLVRHNVPFMFLKSFHRFYCSFLLRRSFSLVSTTTLQNKRHMDLTWTTVIVYLLKFIHMKFF